MNAEIIGLELSAATSIDEIAAEAGDPQIDEVASLLSHADPRSAEEVVFGVRVKRRRRRLRPFEPVWIC